jgi:hypothetical protein
MHEQSQINDPVASLPPRVRRLRLPATVLGAAALAIAIAAPGASAMPAGNDRAGLPAPPNFPTHVAEAPGALTNVPDMHASVAQALAQERQYASYGKATPATPVRASSSGGSTGDDGIGTLPFVLSVVGAAGLGAAGAGGLQLVQGRRRRAAGLT